MKKPVAMASRELFGKQWSTSGEAFPGIGVPGDRNRIYRMSAVLPGVTDWSPHWLRHGRPSPPVFQRHYGVPKTDIRDNLLPILELPGIVLPGKRRFRDAFDLYVDLNLPFADAYHVALMRQLGLKEIVTYDKEFDRVPGLTRIDPGQ